jgi:hypothetical protein
LLLLEKDGKMVGATSDWVFNDDKDGDFTSASFPSQFLLRTADFPDLSGLDGPTLRQYEFCKHQLL